MKLSLFLELTQAVPYGQGRADPNGVPGSPGRQGVARGKLASSGRQEGKCQAEDKQEVEEKN